MWLEINKMATEINNDQFEEEEKFEKAQGRGDNEQEEDYFTFENIRQMALDSEYGHEVDPNDTMNPDGGYNLNLGDLTDNEVAMRRRKIYNYFFLNKCMNSMEFNETFPHLKYMEEVGIVKRMGLRIRNGIFLGIDYRKDSSKKDGGKIYQRLIVKKKNNVFEYSQDKNNTETIKLFKMKLNEARKMYVETPSGQIEEEVRSVMSEDDLGEEDGYAGLGSTVRYKAEEEVSFQRQQENQELSEVINQEVEKTKFALIKEVELDMQRNRDHILGVFGKLVRDNNIEAFGDVAYLDNVEDLLAPISDMQWFKDQSLLRDDDAADKVYEQQMKFIEDNIKDLEQRIAAEEEKGDAANKNLIKAYKDLRDYLNLKIDTLNVYFERPVKAEYFKNRIKKLVKKNARLAFERRKKWVKAKLPEFLAGIVVSVGGIVFSVYKLAESMGRGIVEEGQKALKNLGRKLKEIAARQGGIVGTVLHAVGSLLEHGADGLDVLRDHFIAFEYNYYSVNYWKLL